MHRSVADTLYIHTNILLPMHSIYTDIQTTQRPNSREMMSLTLAMPCMIVYYSRHVIYNFPLATRMYAK